MNLQSRIILNPVRKIRLRGEVKYTDRDNRTDYTALNPLTGEYGYIVMDGGLDALAPSLSGIYNPLRPGSRVRFKNIPFDKDTFLITAGVDYLVTNKLKMGLRYYRDHQDYRHREVDKLIEDRIKLNLVYRDRKIGTLRTSYEYRDRDSDGYNFNPYEEFYTSSLPAYIPRLADGDDPHTLSDLRKYDVASRKKHTLKGKYNSIIVENLDLTLTGQYSDENFDAQYGLREKDSLSANLDLNVYMGLNKSIYAYYSFQSSKSYYANINNAGGAFSDPFAGGPRYPLDRAWTGSAREKNNSIGAGINFGVDDVLINLSYTYIRSRSRFQYNFNSTAAFNNTLTEQEVGTGFPDQIFSNHHLQSNITWSVRENTKLNFLYRYETEKVSDFHYQGITNSIVDDSILLLALPENFNSHVVGLFIENNF